ncbi:MAG: hypothetical protein JNM34_06225 [Chthonomonadaceae bacterium]|nr:hypothetical protein [Chthonomonadaceae bacterium]
MFESENKYYETRPATLAELMSRDVVLPEFEDSPQERAALHKEVAQYVKIESASCTAKGLKFVRNAMIDGVKYWLWTDYDGDYVYSEDYEGDGLMCLADQDGLTPEQFLVKVYLKNQWQIRLE